MESSGEKMNQEIWEEIKHIRNDINKLKDMSGTKMNQEAWEEIQNIRKDINDLKGSLNEMKKAMDEVCALCAAALVASGTKLQDTLKKQHHPCEKNQGPETEKCNAVIRNDQMKEK